MTTTHSNLIGRRFMGRVDGKDQVVLAVSSERVAGMLVVINESDPTDRRPMRDATILKGLELGEVHSQTRSLDGKHRPVRRPATIKREFDQIISQLRAEGHLR